MQAPLTYIPNFLDQPDDSFSRLIPLEWKRLVRNASYFEYYCNDQDIIYFSGRGLGRKTYVSYPWTSSILAIRDKLNTLLNINFNTCFIKRFLNHKDHLGWQSDDSPQINNLQPIAIVSLGAFRDIWFRPKPEELLKEGERRDGKERRFMDRGIPERREGEETERYSLEKGSLLIMAPGMQETWQYRIPKSSIKCDEYMSLTFLNISECDM